MLLRAGVHFGADSQDILVDFLFFCEITHTRGATKAGIGGARGGKVRVCASD